MTVNESSLRLEEAIRECGAMFAHLGIASSGEIFYSSAKFAPVEPENARYVTAVLTLTLGEGEDIHTHDIDIGVEAKRGEIDETELSGALLSFKEDCEALLAQLEESDDVAATLDELELAAEEEYDRLLKKLGRIRIGLFVVGALAVIAIIVSAILGGLGNGT